MSNLPPGVTASMIPGNRPGDDWTDHVRPGDRVYAWHSEYDSGSGVSPMIATVVRVNAVTLTVDYNGERMRVPYENLVGIWIEEVELPEPDESELPDYDAPVEEES